MSDTMDVTKPEGLAADGSIAPSSASDVDGLAISILLLERRSLIRECLAQGLSLGLPQCRVVAWADPLDDEVLSSFDMLIIGLGAEFRRRGTLEKLQRLTAQLPVVAISDDNDSSLTPELLRAGVRAHILASSGLRIITDVLRVVHGGGTYLPNSAFDADVAAGRGFGMISRNDLKMLTPREMDVLRLLGEGKQNKVIAYELDICDSTVKIHVRHVMAKVGATNRTQAALMARELLGEQFY